MCQCQDNFGQDNFSQDIIGIGIGNLCQIETELAKNRLWFHKAKEAGTNQGRIGDRGVIRWSNGSEFGRRGAKTANFWLKPAIRVNLD